jgi:hypothetical protein
MSKSLLILIQKLKVKVLEITMSKICLKIYNTGVNCEDDNINYRGGTKI